MLSVCVCVLVEGDQKTDSQNSSWKPCLSCKLYSIEYFLEGQLVNPYWYINEAHDYFFLSNSHI